MTWSAALPGAAVRVLRAAAGRRALQVGLLVGGLFVLGFLCGEQAQAADGIGVSPGGTVGHLVHPVRPAEPRLTHTAAATATATTAATERDTDRGTDRDRDTAKGDSAKPVASTPGADAPVVPGEDGGSLTGALTHLADDKVLRPVTEGPVTEGLVGAVADGVVRPVGDLVETVTTGLTETIGTPASPALPEWPAFPESPSWPTLPTVPGVPTAPGLPGPPVQTLPAPAPVTSAPQSQPGEHAARKPAGEGSADGGAAFGPRFVGDGGVTEPVARPSAHRTTSTAHAPAHQAPSDNPGGALGGKPAVDNGSSRHGDAHALTPHHRAPLRLVPGAAASVDAAGTRDRHRDIPVFPG